MGEDPESILYIAMTCDTVSDFFDQSLWAGEGKAPLSWRGVEEGIGQMTDAIGGMEDSLGRPPRWTWFVPVDNFMERQYEDSAYLLSSYREIWNECRIRGDEVAWHVYHHANRGEQWQLNADYDEWNQGLKSCRSRMEELGVALESTRIGGTHCSNRIMETLQSLSIRYDASALPGRKRTEGSMPLDWSPTPEAAYYPSMSDYRTPGEPFTGILEIPLSMVDVKAEYDARPYRRYVDLSFRHDALWPGLERALQRRPSYLMTIVHPSAVLGDIVQQPHGLLSFEISEFRRNVASLVECCQAMGRPFKFVTVAELGSILSKTPEMI